MRINWCVLAVLTAPLLLTGCASPADVEQRHAVDMAQYQKDIATANEWNTHVLGIPSSGWLAIIIVGIVFGFILLICAGVWTWNVFERRADDRLKVAAMNSEVRKAIAARATCGVCGYVMTPKAVEDEAKNVQR